MRRQDLENQYFNLEKDTNIHDLSEENVEETTLNYATKVAKSEQLIKQAYVSKSVKCFTIDTQVCYNISSFSTTLTQFVRTENKIFNPKLFAEKLITYYNPFAQIEDQTENDFNSNHESYKSQRGLDLEDFYKLGKKLPNLINEIPVFNFAYGSFTPEIDPKSLVKQRKERTKRTEFTNEQTVRPKNYEEVNKDDGDVTHEIELLKNEIKTKAKNNPNNEIEFYDSLIDKDCLTSTVTNIFHSAFMIKEGMLKIDFKDGKNFVSTVDEDETCNLTELSRRQQVLRFNKTTFDNLRKMHGDY